MAPQLFTKKKVWATSLKNRITQYWIMRQQSVQNTSNSTSFWLNTKRHDEGNFWGDVHSSMHLSKFKKFTKFTVYKFEYKCKHFKILLSNIFCICPSILPGSQFLKPIKS